MTDKKFYSLEELIGEYGKIAISNSPPEVKYKYGEAPNTFAFRLGDKCYLAAENPDDGYRSCLDYIQELDELPDSSEVIERPVNAFRKESYNSNILRVVDEETGHIWLEVGTDNTDDYYPWFVANWFPMENYEK